MNYLIDTSKNLEELEGIKWIHSRYISKTLRTCEKLRHKSLSLYSLEDLRLMISQGLGLDYLVPMAIGSLSKDPLTEAHFYPGDLLRNVLLVDESFWKRHPVLKRKVQYLVEKAMPLPEELQEAWKRFVTYKI